VEVLQEWVVLETEFQIKALETIQGLPGKGELKHEGKKLSHTFLTDLAHTVGWTLTLAIAVVSCVAGNMEYGLAVNLRSWRYQRGGIVPRHLSCVFVV